MPELEDPITEARRLLAERTPGEWVCPDRAYWELLNVHYVNLWAWADPDRRLSHSIGQAYQWADAALIAAAPRLLAALCERLEAAELRASKFGGLVGALRDVRGYAAAFRDAPNHIIERATDILDWASEAAE